MSDDKELRKLIAGYLAARGGLDLPSGDWTRVKDDGSPAPVGLRELAHQRVNASVAQLLSHINTLVPKGVRSRLLKDVLYLMANLASN